VPLAETRRELADRSNGLTAYLRSPAKDGGPPLMAARNSAMGDHYFVLKPKHSRFFDITLDPLLETLRIRRVILTGMAGNICVLFTANDAYVREYKIFAPADCIVSNIAVGNSYAFATSKPC
jgi:nicotinamidase-related amidase